MYFVSSRSCSHFENLCNHVHNWANIVGHIIVKSNTIQIKSYGRIIVANQSKSIIFFYYPLLKTIISRAIFKGPKFKLIFMLYKTYTLSKVLCTCHCIVAHGDIIAK
jgi:hypothetical protein